eukprot:1366930-Amorphochlora_amoeboformis.AAC.1
MFFNRSTISSKTAPSGKSNEVVTILSNKGTWAPVSEHACFEAKIPPLSLSSQSSRSHFVVTVNLYSPSRLEYLNGSASAPSISHHSLSPVSEGLGNKYGISTGVSDWGKSVWIGDDHLNQLRKEVNHQVGRLAYRVTVPEALMELAVGAR